MSVEGAVQVRSPRARPALAKGLFGTIGAGMTLLAIFGEGTLTRAAFGAFAVMMVFFSLYAGEIVAAAQQRVVRVATVGPLRFLPRQRLAVLPVVMSVLGLVPGALSLLAPGLTGEHFGFSEGYLGSSSRWLGLVTVASVAWLIQQAWGLRLLPGLSVTAWGLVGARGGPTVQIPWESFERATAVAGRDGAVLVLKPVGGGALALQSWVTGSDANVVAAIIEHFRTHPDDVEALEDPLAAIRLVEAAQAPAR